MCVTFIMKTRQHMLKWFKSKACLSALNSQFETRSKKYEPFWLSFLFSSYISVSQWGWYRPSGNIQRISESAGSNIFEREALRCSWGRLCASVFYTSLVLHLNPHFHNFIIFSQLQPFCVHFHSQEKELQLGVIIACLHLVTDS